MPKPDFRLIAISDDIRTPGDSEASLVEDTIELAVAYAASGIRAFQLRKKSWSDRAIFRAVNALSREASDFDLAVLVNERADIAQLTLADGLHLPEHGLPLSDARRIYTNGLIGKSCHSIEAAVKAKKDGTDYIIFGPVYETESKKQYGPPLGIEMFRDVCKKVKVPVFAVGGIDPIRAEECLNAGAHGVAVMSALTDNDKFWDNLNGFESALGEL